MYLIDPNTLEYPTRRLPPPIPPTTSLDQQLYKDIEKNGVLTPVIIKGNRIVDGLARVHYAKHLGITSIPIISQ